MADDTSPPRREKRRTPRILRRLSRAAGLFLLGLGLLLTLLSGGLLLFARTETGQAWITDTVNGILARSLASSGLSARFDALSASFPSRLGFRGLSVGDASGPWLHVDKASLRVGWAALRQRQVTLRSLVVDHPVLMRLPQVPRAPQTESAPPPDPAALLTSLNQWLGWLPPLAVENLDIQALTLAPDLVGEAMTLTLRGSASASSHGIQADLSVRRDDKLDAEQAEARLSLQANAVLSFSLALTETSDGLLMRAVPPSLARAPALRFLFQGSAPLADWRADVHLDLLESDPGIPATSLADRVVLTLKGDLGAAVLAPEPSLTWNLTASAGKAATGLWRMAGQLNGQALAHLTGRALLEPAFGAAQDNAEAVAESHAGTSVKALGRLTLNLNGMEWADPRLEALLGPDATLESGGGLQWRGSPDSASNQAGNVDAFLETFTLRGRALSASADASWHLAGMNPLSPLSALNLNLAADVADAAGLTVPGIAAHGPLLTRLRVQGAMSGLNADLSMEGEALTVHEERLEKPHIFLHATDLDISALMEYLRGAALGGTAEGRGGGQGTLEVSGRARGQDMSLNSRWELTPGRDSLTAAVRDLILRAAGVRVEGDARVVLPGSPVSSREEESEERAAPASHHPSLIGTLRAEVTDWTVIGALSGMPLRTGKASLTMDLGSGPEGQTAKAVLGVDMLRMDAPDGEERLFIRTMRGTARMEDMFRAPRVAADISGDDIRAEGMELRAVHLTATGPLDDFLTLKAQCRGDVTADLDASWKPGEAAVRALQLRASERLVQALRSDTEGSLGAPPAAAKQTPGSSASTGPWGVRLVKPAFVHYGPSGFSTPGLDLALEPSGVVHLDGTINAQSLNLAGTVDALELGSFRAWLPALPEGMVQARLTLTGTPAWPGGDLVIRLNRLQRSGSLLPPLSCSLKGTLKRDARGAVLDAVLSFPPEAMQALGAKQAAASLSLPLSFGADGLPQPVPAAALRGEVLWEGELAPLWNFVPLPDRRLSGQGGLRLAVAGSLERPELTGHVAISQAAYEDLNLGLLLSDIDAMVNLDKGTGAAGPLGALGRTRLSLKAGDGTDGTLTLEGFVEPSTLAVELKGGMDNFKPLRRQDVRMTLSGDATVTGILSAPDVRAALTVNQGELIISHLSGASIPVLPISDAEEESAEPPPPAPLGNMDVEVTVPSRFFVRGHGLESDWRGQVRARGPLNAPELVGSLSAARGTLDLLNRTFFLTKGVIILDGGQTINPRLDIIMTYTASNLEADVNIGGTASRPRLELSSKPAMPQDEIIAQVMFGRPAGKLGHVESLQMAAAVAALAGFGSGGSGAFDVMRKALGTDVVRLGSTEGSEGGLGGTTLEMGKYINDRVYVGVSQGLDGDSTGAVVNVDLTRHITLDARTTSTKSEVGVEWSYDY
ncbi:MAG: translocation/assembly module TamB domain-containing protein [Desulfovibrionaceae bacterium]|nr:translocation/assembly module TamB domain-containing protein [Desulfovibrionaceae bacterium]